MLAILGTSLNPTISKFTRIKLKRSENMYHITSSPGCKAFQKYGDI